jgi:DNA-binding NarL/FixJ family response regulator
MRILILDDHRLFLDGLHHVLRQFGEQTVIEEAQSTRQALELISNESRYNLILADLSLPGLDGFAFLQALRERRITTPVVVISGTTEVGDVRRALDNGALGFIPKSMGSAQVLAALEQVLHGDVYVPPDLWSTVFDPNYRERANDDRPEAPLGIGARQMDVLKLMAQGCSNKEIATILDISEATVKSHVGQLFRALDVKNRTACVREATRRQLVSLADR